MAARPGVSVVDLKEPARGALGRVDPVIAHRIAASAGPRATLSIALGELPDFKSHNLAYLRGFTFAKIGLSGMHGRPVFRCWQNWATAIGEYCRPVVVAYADWQRCDAPDPACLAQMAIDVQAPFFLLDTCHKDGLSLMDFLSVPQLSRLVDRLTAHGVPVATAGSLDVPAILRLSQLPIQLIGVRGMVCRCGNRNCVIDPVRIDALSRLLNPGMAEPWLLRPVVSSAAASRAAFGHAIERHA